MLSDYDDKIRKQNALWKRDVWEMKVLCFVAWKLCKTTSCNENDEKILFYLIRAAV